MDYPLPTMETMPEYAPDFVDHPFEGGPFGAKGMGEIGSVVVPGAVLNAVYDATGVLFHEVPLLPYKILEGLDASGGQVPSPLRGEGEDEGGSSPSREGWLTMKVELTINGGVESVEVAPSTTLLDLIRDQPRPEGYERVLPQRRLRRRARCSWTAWPLGSCSLLAGQANGADILTIEGLTPDEGLHPIQQAFVDHFGLQCGYWYAGDDTARQGAAG